jgi:hypothetical protein
MKLVATSTPMFVSEQEETLAAHGIPYQREEGESEEGCDEVRLYVAEPHFARAAALLESLDEGRNADLDLRGFDACPRCGASRLVWTETQTDDGPVEILLCACSGGQPIAVRDPVTKRGGLLDGVGDEGP